MKHTCHLRYCDSPCPPRHLFCRKHWAMVPLPTQREVYRTVKLRGTGVDKTWAPWWRAQAAAESAVMLQMYPDEIIRISNMEARANKFADKLEGRGAS